MKKFSLLLMIVALGLASCEKEDPEVKGCTDTTAKNYNADADTDDGSCTYALKGCTSAEALNFNATAEEDDGSCKYVPEERKAFLTKQTGSLCPPCGSWGWTLLEEIIDTKDHSDAVVVAAYSDNFVAKLFITDIATALDDRWGVNSWPTFTVNGTKATGSTIPQIAENVYKKIDEGNAKPVVVNTGFITTYDESTRQLTITSKTKFFQNADGDYNLSFYITEDHVHGAQSGHPQTPDVYHHKVLRATADGEAFGERIASGTNAAGTVIDKNYTYTLDPSWDASKIEVSAVLWKRIGGSFYTYENASYAVELE